MGAEETQADRDRGYSQPSGHFVRGILQDIAQETDLAQVRREARNSAREQPAQFTARVALFGIIRPRCEPATESILRSDSGFLQRYVLPFAALADQID